MRKREKINSIFKENGKLSFVRSFDFIAPVKGKKNGTPTNSVLAGVLTFAFHQSSIIEFSGRLEGGSL